MDDQAQEVTATIPTPPQAGTALRIDAPSERVLRVAAGSNVNDVAWGIVKAFEEGFKPVLVGIGVQAVSQAVKSIAVANSRVAPQGKMFTAIPAFETTKISKRETKDMVDITAIKFILLSYVFR